MMEGRRVLVVEDDDGLRETLVEVLRDEGHEVRAASDGAIALGTLEEWDADLILLDVMMPRMDAFAFRSAQRARGAALDAKVIVLSAAPEIETAADQLGADRWLPKPFRLTDVLGSVDELLDGDA
jgi:two-component system, chemotaxis family, chemotaxis protein CheY